MTRPDIEAIAARCKERQEFARSCRIGYPTVNDAMYLLAYIAELEESLTESMRRKDLDIQIECTTKCRENSVAAINELQAAKAAFRATLEAAERERVRIADQAFKTIKSWKDRTVSAETNLATAQADVRAFKFALGRIAIYGKDGICPYGCDCPDIASKALTSPTVRTIVEGP